jgi:membrane-associated progesterone receptor component
MEEQMKNVLENDLPNDMEIGSKVSSWQIVEGAWEKLLMTWQGQVIADFIHFCKLGEYDKSKDLLERFPFLFTIVFVVTFMLCYSIMSYFFGAAEDIEPAKPVEEEEPLPDPRDFTEEQLREFNGVTNPSIYIALKGDVYDCTKSVEYYGAEGPYHCFAGRNATRAMAKLSFEESELCNPDYSKLGPFERDTLEDWVSKFKHYKVYPVVGRLSEPPRIREYIVSDLSAFKGKQEIPEGRVHSSILIALRGVVYDVSFGGYEMYCEGAGYHVFAGKDASRCFALMSLKEEDSLSSDLSDLTETQQKTLDDWIKKFDKKKYPVVGKISQQ